MISLHVRLNIILKGSNNKVRPFKYFKTAKPKEESFLLFGRFRVLIDSDYS
jgi:hypothetical protein